jgi:chromobox protein 1
MSDAYSTSKKRKQSSTPTVKQARKRGANKDDAEPPNAKRKIKGAAPAWEPPTGLWEEDVVSVESVEQVPDPKTGELVLMGYVVWKDDRKTQHGLQQLYKKCPQKVSFYTLARSDLANRCTQMLQYYERHL